jgi:hypothetical protein
MEKGIKNSDRLEMIIYGAQGCSTGHDSLRHFSQSPDRLECPGRQSTSARPPS